MVGYGKVSWRMIGGEVAALTTAVLSTPLRWLVLGEHLDRAASDEPPVVFVHGLLGDPTNFLVIRRALGERSSTSFAYAPRFDYQRLAAKLERRIEDVRAATGARQVDVVGHSLGGLIARYLVETDRRHLVRRLVTLGAPYYTSRFPRRELAIFGAEDLLVPSPDPRHAPRARVVPHCGHLGLLYHPAVVDEVAAYLGRQRGASCSGLTLVAQAAA